MYWGSGVDIPRWQHLLLLKVRGVRRPGAVFLKVFRRAINDIEGYDECNSKEARTTEISLKIPPTWFANTLDEVKGKKRERKKQDKTKRRKCVATWLKQVTARHPSSWHSVTCSWGLWHLILDICLWFCLFNCLCLCICLRLGSVTFDIWHIPAKSGG